MKTNTMIVTAAISAGVAEGLALKSQKKERPLSPLQAAANMFRVAEEEVEAARKERFMVILQGYNTHASEKVNKLYQDVCKDSKTKCLTYCVNTQSWGNECQEDTAGVEDWTKTADTRRQTKQEFIKAVEDIKEDVLKALRGDRQVWGCPVPEGATVVFAPFIHGFNNGGNSFGEAKWAGDIMRGSFKSAFLENGWKTEVLYSEELVHALKATSFERAAMLFNSCHSGAVLAPFEAVNREEYSTLSNLLIIASSPWNVQSNNYTYSKYFSDAPEILKSTGTSDKWTNKMKTIARRHVKQAPFQRIQYFDVPDFGYKAKESLRVNLSRNMKNLREPEGDWVDQFLFANSEAPMYYLLGSKKDGSVYKESLTTSADSWKKQKKFYRALAAAAEIRDVVYGFHQEKDELVGKFSEKKPDWTRAKPVWARAKTVAQKNGFVSLKNTIGVLSKEQMRLLRENLEFGKKYGYKSEKLERILPMMSLKHGKGGSFLNRRKQGAQMPRKSKKSKKSKRDQKSKIQKKKSQK